MGVVDDLEREREALARTIASIDAKAPAGCGEWLAGELAVHLALGEMFAAVPNAPFRWLVGHGVRLDRMAQTNKRALQLQLRRHDRAWALDRLSRPTPRLHRLGVVAVTSLLEFWAHHEDVLAANNLGPCGTNADLQPVVGVLVRYQRRSLERHAVRITCAGDVLYEPATAARVEVDGAVVDLARWLSGRGTTAPLAVSSSAERADALAADRLHI